GLGAGVELTDISAALGTQSRTQVVEEKQFAPLRQQSAAFGHAGDQLGGVHLISTRLLHVHLNTVSRSARLRQHQSPSMWRKTPRCRPKWGGLRHIDGF